jgi:hypothetical protein
MGKRKVILLPDDARILDLFKGNIGAEKEDVETKIPKAPARKQRRTEMLWYEVLIEKTVVVALLPFILLAIIVMIPALIIGHLLPGNKGDAFQAKFFERLDLFKKLVPFRNRDKLFEGVGKKHRWKGVEEDVPAMLEKARKFNYQIIIYVKNTNDAESSKIQNLLSTGWIDEVIQYNNKNEILTYIKNEDVCQQSSWIIEVPDHDLQLSTDYFKNILFVNKVPLRIKQNSREFNTFKSASEKMIFTKIQLKRNPLLNSAVVLYFEKEHEPEVNSYIITHYHHIQKVLGKRGLQLLYFPVIKQFEKLDVNIASAFDYAYPDLFLGANHVQQENIEQWVKDIDLAELYNILESTLEIPELPLPGFIRCLEDRNDTTKDELTDYSFFPVWGKEEKTIKEEIEHYLSVVGVITDGPMYQLVGRNNFQYDADYWFYSDGADINKEIKAKIDEIKTIAGGKPVFETLFYVINEFKDINPELCKKLCKQLYDEAGQLERKLSRLYINKGFRIFLSDYNNMEIEMTPLPKTLFLFMLKYPNGVMLKELYKHKQELLYIYGRISNRSDLDQMQNSINDMTNATSNSVNEKCSRIKEAFVSKIDERIACSYFITGERQEPKRILLDRSLVVFEEMV